jgi:Tol biopolymer transport system component
MGANGSNPVRLTTQVVDDIDPTWSPDGTKIAFVSYRDGNAELYVMNADGQNPVRLTNNNVEDLQPDWSPDGTKLAFSRAAGCDSYSGFCYYGLWIMNVDGSNATPITGGAADNSPSWSPDGLWIAYGSDVCEDYYYYNYGCYYSYSAVRLLRVDGSRSFDLAYDAFQPAWRR